MKSLDAECLEEPKPKAPSPPSIQKLETLTLGGWGLGPPWVLACFKSMNVSSCVVCFPSIGVGVFSKVSTRGFWMQ